MCITSHYHELLPSIQTLSEETDPSGRTAGVGPVHGLGGLPTDGRITNSEYWRSLTEHSDCRSMTTVQQEVILVWPGSLLGHSKVRKPHLLGTLQKCFLVFIQKGPFLTFWDDFINCWICGLCLHIVLLDAWTWKWTIFSLLVKLNISVPFLFLNGQEALTKDWRTNLNPVMEGRVSFPH